MAHGVSFVRRGMVQLVPNAATLLIKLISKGDHVTPKFKEVH